jgi:C-terminal processing protease CtpA/Prc
MNVSTHIFFALIVISFQLANAQESVKQSAATQFQSIEANKALEEYYAQLAKAEEEMIEKKKAIYSSLTKKLSEAITQEIAKQNLKEVEAISSFLNQGNAETKLNSLAKQTKDPFKNLSGSWKGNFGTTGNEFEMRIKGVEVFDVLGVKLNPVTKDGRVVYFGHPGENFELIPVDERLIVLAWGTQDGLDPWKDQPNHIAILKRGKDK